MIRLLMNWLMNGEAKNLAYAAGINDFPEFPVYSPFHVDLAP